MIETRFLVDGKLYNTYRDAEEAEKIQQMKKEKIEKLNAKRLEIKNLIPDELAKMLIGKASEIKLYCEEEHQNRKFLTFYIDDTPFTISYFIVQKRMNPPYEGCILEKEYFL